MKHPTALLALTMLLASCATLHKETTSNTASASDTTHVTVVDTTHVTIIHERDSIDNAQSHRRDSIIIKEVITNHYDPTTGMMIEQVIDKLTSQVTDLSEYRETILHQQQLIDSLLTANMSLSSSHQKDSTYTSDIKEKGDAARSGWQSTLNSGKYISLFGLLALLVVIILQHYRKK
jgi:PBP1b-binding outer membrane lipoprotein LpoB